MMPDEYFDAYEFDQDPAAEVDGIRTEHDEQFYFDGMEEQDQLLQLQRYLHESDLNEIEAPSTETWIDSDPTTLRTVFKINEARKQNMELAKEEARCVIKRVNEILDVADRTDVDFADLVHFLVGANSELGKVLKKELGLDDKEYLEFMITYCVQCAYNVSSTQIYDSISILKDHVEMSKENYNKIWKDIASKTEQSGVNIGTSRRGLCLWQKLENAVNHVMRSISVEYRPGKISIALDDDKIWYNMENKQSDYTFGLKITRHVKDNRIGMILHTAVSTSLNIPLCCTFEKIMDSTGCCYERIFNFMFGMNGTIDLRNVNVHSDRGYSLPSVVFELLIKNGANVCCTIKRYLQCWPFTYNQKRSANDKRTHIDVDGAPTLYTKSTAFNNGMRTVLAGAFRNGSGAVSTIVSSMRHISPLQWEGVTKADGSKMSRMYEEDKESLKSLFFNRVDDIFDDEEDIIDKDLCSEFISVKIDPLSLHQGKQVHIMFFVSVCRRLILISFGLNRNCGLAHVTKV